MQTEQASATKRKAPKKQVSANLSGSESFVAIDFETANRFRHSACAVSVVRVDQGLVTKTLTYLIKPPELYFEFTHIHGIGARHVASAPSFPEIYSDILDCFKGAEFIAAHNASFDKSVFKALCAYWQLDLPAMDWRCTVKLARQKWEIFPTKLPDVCGYLNIELKHHDATSDATACARIVIAASRNSASIA